MLQYSLLGRTYLNITFRGLAPSPSSSGRTESVNQFCLRMGTEPVPETLYLNQLTRMIAREDYIESCRRESFTTYIMLCFLIVLWKRRNLDIFPTTGCCCHFSVQLVFLKRILSHASPHECLWESAGIAPRICNLCSRCSRVVSITPLQLYVRCSLDSRLNGIQRMDVLRKGKLPRTCQKKDPNSSVVQPVA
jgi:hypothetical protein